MKKYPKILYRNNDCYGDRVYDIVKVITYEICELHNVDILDYCMFNYKLLPDLVHQMDKMINKIDNIKETPKIVNIIKRLVGEISAIKGKELKYCLWLTDKESVEEYYSDNLKHISAYKTSDTVLSDLEDEGVLFAYDKFPKELKGI